VKGVESITSEPMLVANVSERMCPFCVLAGGCNEEENNKGKQKYFHMWSTISEKRITRIAWVYS
jgi:hypothetical protein